MARASQAGLTPDQKTNEVGRRAGEGAATAGVASAVGALITGRRPFEASTHVRCPIGKSHSVGSEAELVDRLAESKVNDLVKRDVGLARRRVSREDSGCVLNGISENKAPRSGKIESEEIDGYSVKIILDRYEENKNKQLTVQSGYRDALLAACADDIAKVELIL